MVTFQITVDSQLKNLYMDDNLHRQLNTNIRPKVQKKDWDSVYIVDGGEGVGKSVFAQQVGKVLDPTLTNDRVCFTPDEFTKAVIKARKGQCVIFDEAFTGLSSRGSLTEVNKLLVSLMMEMRQKNLFVIIVMPTFFLLDRYVAIWRARGLFHVYTKNSKRGYWMFFNNQKKKLLYILGKKLYDYSQPKSSFRGKFYDQYTINEEAYRIQKKEAMNKKSRTTKAITFMNQRNILFWIMYEELQINQVKIASLCKKFDYKIDRGSIANIILEKKKDMLREEALRELVEEQSDELDVKLPKFAQKLPSVE